MILLYRFPVQIIHHILDCRLNHGRDIMSPKRSSSCDEYKAWLKAEYDIDWDAGGREVPDLTEPQDTSAEVRD